VKRSPRPCLTLPRHVRQSLGRLRPGQAAHSQQPQRRLQHLGHWGWRWWGEGQPGEAPDGGGGVGTGGIDICGVGGFGRGGGRGHAAGLTALQR